MSGSRTGPDPRRQSGGRVAVIGAGPAGLAVTRTLLRAGMAPDTFERAGDLGGQWCPRNPASGIWPGMPTNTSREMTRFSELDYPDGTGMFPRMEEVHRYLLAYASRFGLQQRIRFRHTVVGLKHNGQTWELQIQAPGGVMTTREYPLVVVCSGRFSRPVYPDLPGVEEQEPGGALRVTHARDYAGPQAFDGQRVVVAGGAISALEIASELAARGACSVTLASRRQRYVLRKHHQGIPTDHLNYCLAEVLAAERLSADEIASELKEFILHTAGNPARFGAAQPADDIREAGVTKCESFLDEVAAGRIQCRPWLRRVGPGASVEFVDGSHAGCDALICATGYAPELAWLDEEIRSALALDGQFIALHHHTFHPDLPGLAMLGFFDQSGPYFPVIELQARWIAGAFSGQGPVPDASEVRDGFQAVLAQRDAPQKFLMHRVAAGFARELGALPDPGAWPGLARCLLFGPLSPGVFRLEGPDALPGAPAMVRRAARAFGMIEGDEFTGPERRRLRQLGIETGQERANP